MPGRNEDRSKKHASGCLADRSNQHAVRPYREGAREQRRHNITGEGDKGLNLSHRWCWRSVAASFYEHRPEIPGKELWREHCTAAAQCDTAAIQKHSAGNTGSDFYEVFVVKQHRPDENARPKSRHGPDILVDGNVSGLRLLSHSQPAATVVVFETRRPTSGQLVPLAYGGGSRTISGLELPTRQGSKQASRQRALQAHGSRPTGGWHRLKSTRPNCDHSVRLQSARRQPQRMLPSAGSRAMAILIRSKLSGTAHLGNPFLILLKFPLELLYPLLLCLPHLETVEVQ